jgi:signal transduction histidine kinase
MASGEFSNSLRIFIQASRCRTRYSIPSSGPPRLVRCRDRRQEAVTTYLRQHPFGVLQFDGMPERDAEPDRTGNGRRAVTAEVQRRSSLIAAALVVIAMTAVALSIVDVRPRWMLGLIVAIETAVALAVLARLAARSMAQARQLDHELRHKARLIALLDSALSSSPVGFGFFDRDLRFLRVNATLAKWNGRAPEDHIGLSLEEIDPRIARDVLPRLREVLETRQAVSNIEFEGPVPGRPAEASHWLTSCYPIVTPEGELFGVGIAITDVSDMKRLEQQLVQAQKMEAVGRLAGGVAHDFNNLLTVINSFAELILYDPEMSKGREEIQEIRSAAARAAKLTRQLLAFSRRQAMEPRIVNPNDVLRGVETLLRRLVVGNVDIVTTLSTDTPVIRVDPGQLEQVVMNLAINAADAMPEGGRLRIETSGSALGEGFNRLDPDFVPGDYAMIRVSDTGHGMSPDVIEKIFEPFFTTKEEGRGTGLGLSTVYGIVKQFGGQVDVESDPGSGSVFTVYLPTIAEGGSGSRVDAPAGDAGFES